MEDKGAGSTLSCFKQLQLGKQMIAHLLVVHRVVSPHELMYTADGQLAMYNSLFVPLFFSGYMQVMVNGGSEARYQTSTHFVELMSDAELYGWEAVHAFRVVWLQQLEHGRVNWADEETKQKFQRVFM